MSAIPPILADEYLEQVLASWRLVSPSTRSGLIVLGAIGLVCMLAVIWAVFLRKRQQPRTHHHAHHHPSTAAVAAPASGDEGVALTPRRRRKWRRPRRAHRRRSPTLAETGGLPPVRSESPLQPER